MLVNLANSHKEYMIRFFDPNGGIIFETESEELKPFGSKIIVLNKFSKLKKSSGLAVLECGSGISGEYRYRADGGPLRGSVPLKEGMPPFSVGGYTIFISFAMKEKNDSLYDLTSRMIKSLGFTVLSAKETGRADLAPGTQISDLIAESDALLAILTKDIKSEHEGKEIFYSSQNVIDEIGQAAEKPVIIIAEETIEIPSNIETRATYLTFSTNRTGEMLVKLTEAMKKIKIF